MKIVQTVRQRPRLVLAAALLFTLAMAVIGAGAQKALLTGGTTDPGADSSWVTSQIDRMAPGLAPDLAVLVDTPNGPDSASAREAGQKLAAVLRAEPTATSVDSYWDARTPALVSHDGKHALVLANLSGDESAIRHTMEHLRPALHGAQHTHGIELAGSAIVRIEMDDKIASDLLKAEMIAIPITFLLLLLVFGGLAGALLPLGVGIFAIVTTQAVLRLIAAFTPVSVFALNLTTALGLGLAIDYALLIVRRYGEERNSGRDHELALRNTMGSAGRTVAYSGLTVASALAVMLIFPLYFLRSFAYAGVVVVLASMLGALVITPVAMTVLQKRLGRPSRRARRIQARPARQSGWLTLTLWVIRRAVIVAPLSIIALVLVALPFASVRFGNSDERQLQPSAAVRQAQTVIEQTMPAGHPPLAIVSVPAGASAADVQARLHGLAGIDDVTSVRTADSTFLVVSSALAPLSQPAQQLVHSVRAEVSPYAVGGDTAALIDTKSAISSRLPWALLLVLAAALILVFLLTGSVLLPVVTVITNGLSLSAMFGAIVWVFQDGHLSGLLGFTPTGTIDVSLPALLTCVAFGLSMDYGVFVVARLVEEHRHGGDMTQVLSRGMTRTSGLITAAALILSTVLVAIGTSSITNTKMLGLGLALAVIVDATVVRGVVLPAVLTLLGPATWWAPSALRRLHDRYGWREDGSHAPRPVLDGYRSPTRIGEREPLAVAD